MAVDTGGSSGTDSKKEAAERLGISPRTLRHKLQKLKAAEPDSLQSIGAS